MLWISMGQRNKATHHKYDIFANLDGGQSAISKNGFWILIKTSTATVLTLFTVEKTVCLHLKCLLSAEEMELGD